MKKKYNIIYSIGRDCSCAMYMQKTKLRSFSDPFDWLTNANFEDRCKLILNDFKYFLDVNCIKLMPKPEGFPSDKNHNYYENTKTNLYFWHDFPANLDFDTSYEQVLQKYQRRISNFYSNINNKENVLLIWFSQVDNTPDEVILKYCNKINAKFGKCIDFLIIEHQEALNKTKSYMLANNIQRFFCHATKTNEKGEPQTLGNKTLIKPIFKKFKLIISLDLKIRNFIIRLLSHFVPIKSWRTKIRSFTRNIK